MRFSAVLLPVLLTTASVVGAEVPGEDHPLLPRYRDAEIRSYRAPSTDEIVIPTGPVGNVRAPASARTVEGQVTHIDYRIEPATATLQVGRYYEGVLRSAGYSVTFSCAGEKACGGGMGELILNSGKVAPEGFADGLFGDRMRVIVAQRGSNWVLLHIYEGPDRTMVYEAVVDSAPALAAAAAGPKVHASKSKDITDCSQLTSGGGRTAAALGLGGLLGSKLGGGSTGVLAGSAAVGLVGQHLDRQAKCGPSADVENNAAPAKAPKKKFGLKSLLGQ